MKEKLKKTGRITLALARVGFKLQNENSYLGIIWQILDPLLIFLLLIFIFTNRLGVQIPNYPAYLFVGIIIFSFFQKTTIEATMSIKNNSGLIRSTKFPHETLIGSIVIKNLFSHFLEIIILVVLLLILKISLWGLIFYVLILPWLGIFIYAVSLILSSIVIYVPDIQNIWIFTSRLIWLGTPIFYAIANQERLFLLNLFNPIYYFITIAREIIIYTRVPELWLIIGMLGYTLLALLVGSFIFNRLKQKFAEVL